MREIWFVSDHHLFHDKILTFEDDYGKRIRPFDSITQMHDCILTNHNEVVKDGDIVYFMGDLTMDYGPEFEAYFAQFKGRKRLIPGNHDKIKKLMPYFQKISIWRVFREPDIKDFVPFTVSHVPVAWGSVKGEFNVHGHLHQNLVKSLDPDEDWINPRYINVSLEQTDFRPVSMTDLQIRMNEYLDQ